MSTTTADVDVEVSGRGACSIAFRVSPDVWAAVTAIAAEEGIGKGCVARRALLRELRERSGADA